MRTVQSQPQNEDLRNVVERIVHDLEDSRAYKGKLSVERVLPPPNVSTNTPAGYPHLTIEMEERTMFLWLIPHTRKRVILIVKEGFYDIEDKGRKDVFVLLKSKSCEVVARKHFAEYGTRNQATEIVYKS